MGKPARRQGPAARALIGSIKAIQVEVKTRYGSPRVHADLDARGGPCCVKTVVRLMRHHGVAAEAKRKSRCTIDSNHVHHAAENGVNRDLEPMAADRTWAADMTSIATGEG